MKLHTAPGSPSGRKVQAVILHLKLDVQVQNHDFAKGELRAPEYLALNPNGSVPTLVDGDFVLWESNAIMQYLADKAGDQLLFPRDLQCAEWTKAPAIRRGWPVKALAIPLT